AGSAASGLHTVELWARTPGASSYSKVATDSTPSATGSFSYTAASDGSYSFYTVATDAAGNVEAAPATADATTAVDTGAPASRASSPHYSASTTIAVTYSAADSVSGVRDVELWAREPGSTSYTRVAVASSGSFTYTASAGD